MNNEEKILAILEKMDGRLSKLEDGQAELKAEIKEINLSIKDTVVPKVEKFNKTTFNADELMSTASELRYTNLIKNFLAQQAKEPEENFITYILDEVYEGPRTEPVIQKFKDIIRKSFGLYVNDVLNDIFDYRDQLLEKY